jgi:magnesium transporter
MEKMAAILPSDKPYLRTGVIETWKARLPWLMLLMLSATFTSIILTHFEDALGTFTILTAFVPMLTGTGGNSGTQSSTAVIRAISLDEVDFSDLLVVIWKEIRVAVLCGVCLAAANFVKMLLVDGLLLNNPAVTPMVAAVVCLTLVGIVICAKTVGCILPMLVEKVGFDPAVVASPFISTVVDALSLLIYFAIASRLMGI